MNNKSKNLEKIHAEKPTTDSFSKEEESAIFEKNYKKIIYNVFYNVAADIIKILGIVGMYLIPILIASFLSVWTWHILAPNEWRWLSEDGAERITNVIIAVIAGITTRFFPSSKE